MKATLRATAAVVLLAAASCAFAQQEIVLHYPYPDLFNETHKRIAEAFSQSRKDIKLSFRAPYKDYEDATQRVLREAVTGEVPDVTFQGLNRVRVFADKGIAVALDGFIAAEKNFEAAGFHKAMFDAGTVNGKVYGVPFAISLPIVYYNLDLVRKAGGAPDRLPKTWEEVIALARKIEAVGGDVHGVAYEWSITGNWLWQAPVFGKGGTMLSPDESRVAFDEEAGRAAIRTLARLVTEAKMPNFSGTDMRTAFAAGKIGMLVTSTAYLNTLSKQIGERFELRTSVFPDLQPSVSRLPAGGNVAIITARTPERQRAAWEVVKFWTGARAGAIMVETTGYMAPNKASADLLEDFYKHNPNQYTAVSQLSYLSSWYAFPGENGLKITDVIKDHLQTVMSGQRAAEPEKVLAQMSSDVQKLLPPKR
ncbi:MAG TPA: ABC transporter substrate-binding protein [Burkholderiales bacterium]|nr:ABC transporter substrate-binding protein [Burkholderiales bacterium]